MLKNMATMQEEQKKAFEDYLKKMQLSSSTLFDTSGSIKKLDVSNKIGYFTTSSALSLSINTKNPALLVVSDLYYPGWKAFLDNKECLIFRTDCLFRTVLIPAGTHQLLFEYRPLSFIVGLFFFVITVVTLSLLWIKHLLHKASSADAEIGSQTTSVV
jgi:uncharacterized membrane protein YfhO